MLMMIFILILIYKTLLSLAIEKEYIEIIQMLLSYPGIDVNMKFISTNNFFLNEI